MSLGGQTAPCFEYTAYNLCHFQCRWELREPWGQTHSYDIDGRYVASVPPARSPDSRGRFRVSVSLWRGMDRLPKPDSGDGSDSEHPSLETTLYARPVDRSVYRVGSCDLDPYTAISEVTQKSADRIDPHNVLARSRTHAISAGIPCGTQAQCLMTMAHG